MELELGGSRPLCLAWIATHVPASKGRSHDAAAEPCRPTPFAANFNYCRTETLWGSGMRNAGGRCRWDVEAAGFSLSVGQDRELDQGEEPELPAMLRIQDGTW